MTLEIKHQKVSAEADGPDADLVQPSDWNELHTISMATQRLIGRQASGAGAAEEIAPTDTVTISWDWGTAGQLKANVIDASITDAKLRNSAALSVIGRSANSSGAPADIAAASDGHVLRRSGTALSFGTLVTASYGDGTVSYAKIVTTDIATDANVRAAAASKLLPAAAIETASALVTLTETAGAVAVDWDAFIAGEVTVDQTTTISNPTNGQPGTFRTITVKGNDATDRSILFGTNFEGDLPSITDCDSTTWYDLYIRCITTSHFTVVAHKSNKP